MPSARAYHTQTGECLVPLSASCLRTNVFRPLLRLCLCRQSRLVRENPSARAYRLRHGSVTKSSCIKQAGTAGQQPTQQRLTPADQLCKCDEGLRGGFGRSPQRQQQPVVWGGFNARCCRCRTPCHPGQDSTLPRYPVLTRHRPTALWHASSQNFRRHRRRTHQHLP